MCGRFSLHSPAQIIAELFKIQWNDFDIEPRYNLAPTQKCPVILNDLRGQRVVEAMRWGLIPAWAKDEKIGSKMINARCETVAEKPSFRKAWRRRRCVVPINGFFEWQQIGKEKQPFFIYAPEVELLAMAGLWECWRGERSEIRSFTVLTRPAEGRVKALHHRMPVFVPLGLLDSWLKGDQRCFDEDWFLAPPKLEFHPVSMAVNSVKNDSPHCIENIENSEPYLPF